MLWGIVFGLAVAVAGRLKLFDDSPSTSALWPGPVAAMTAVGCACAMGAYSLFCAHCASKPECNAVHSYMSIVPVSPMRFCITVVGKVFYRFTNG